MIRAPEEYTALGQRLLRPDRRVLSRTDIDADDPAFAWEQLASRGLIPSDWVQCPRRRFAAGLGVSWERASVQPPTLTACLGFAGDVKNVLRAEALAREAVSRLRPFGHRGEARVLWRTDGVRGRFRCSHRVYLCGLGDDEPLARAWTFATRLMDLVPEDDLTRIQSAVECLLFASGFPKPPRSLGESSVLAINASDRLDGWFAENVVACALADAAWNHLRTLHAASGEVYRAEAFDDDGMLERSFAELPFISLQSPFEALLGLSETGYVFDWLDGDTVVLTSG